MATDLWYNEVEYYDFNTPGGFFSATGHFTQVVWKGTTKLGCGLSGDYVVCRYSERGNLLGAFEENVLPYDEDMDFDFGTMPMCEGEGSWIEVFDNEYITTNLASDVMTITINFDQQYYLDDLLHTFSDYDGTGKPPNAIYIHSRLRTFDSITGVEVSDYVTIKVIGTGQSLSAACNFETLLGLKDTGRFTLD